MDFVSALLGVIAIIGIIAIGGFVVFFLVDLALSVLDPNYIRFGQGKKKDTQIEKMEKLEIKNEKKEIEYKPIVEEAEKIEDATVTPIIEEVVDDIFGKEDLSKTSNFLELKEDEEKFKTNILKEIEERKNKKLQKNESEEIDFDKFFFGDDDLSIFENEKPDSLEGQQDIFADNFSADNFSFDSSLVTDFASPIEIKAMEDSKEMKERSLEETTEEETTEKISSEKVEAENFPQESKIEISKDLEPKKVETEEISEEIVKKDESKGIEIKEEEEAIESTEVKIDEEIKNLKEQYEAEIAKLRAEKFEIKEKFIDLQKENAVVEKEISKLREEQSSGNGASDKSVTVLTMEEYEAQLLKLKERLSENEKVFRKIKKEFIPLRRVNKTLESDEKKLRRREAIVAKQKVELYGVNNMTDIDQDKVQKLTQDLDLLEGLKLSVKHCQEVMDANKERYPFLEQTYTILFNNNKMLKEDIEFVESKITELKDNE